MKLIILSVIIAIITLAFIQVGGWKNDNNIQIFSKTDYALEAEQKGFNCETYIANYSKTITEFDQQPFAYLCEVDHLLKIAKPVTELSDRCEILTKLENKLPIRSFPNSLSQRLYTDETVFSDEFDGKIIGDCESLYLPEENWDRSFQPIAVGDWNEDGKTDYLVLFSDISNIGSYNAIYPLVVEEQNGRLIAKRFCNFANLSDEAIETYC